MPTRYNSKSQSRFNVPGLNSGYDSKSAPDLVMPSVGIEDVDVALFNLFDKEIPFQIGGKDVDLKKVPVLFAAGEKWALLKNGRALRDRNASLILPLITIMRTSIKQSSDEDITGRGINQQTGEIIITRRLDKSDRGYQNLINRLLLNNQTNLAVSPANGVSGQLTSDRKLGDLASDLNVQEGALLIPNKKNNIYETIVLPSPQFFTAVYEVTMWTQYTQHMNQLTEQLISSFLPQGNAWRLDTQKGYWFVASVEGNIYNAESNFDDMLQSERVIKLKFTVNVPGYILATQVPGAPVPIKRYVSSPIISFDIGLKENEQIAESGIDDPFLGADDPTLPLNDVANKRSDQRQTQSTRLYPNVNSITPEDPALKALPRGTDLTKYKRITGLDNNGNTVSKYVRVVSVNRYTGETVFAADTDLGGLTIVLTD
jgi:hypothetical protein